ncbi:Acetyl-hydrolase [Tolypocladium ophioglossoides CBS 100239]|uniref:Acetyl-hydrolase n=1 Tax=Tolypocladium ophioglossoides (strain CBS 100239) TaxID=1163406 RepID=A0A0L0MXC4_TOLOC|nr:Acetyl-hydrolase [Tolypocladium ophioglossoides CBS 100239]
MVDSPSSPAAQGGGGGGQANLRMLKVLLPKLPLMLRVTVAHVLNLSETAPYLDLRSALIVSVVRAFLEPDPSRPHTMSSVQRLSTRDPGVKGRLWVSTYVSPPPPEAGARDALRRALEALREPPAQQLEPAGSGSIPVPEYVPVEAEWTGYRAAAKPNERPPAISERAKYHEMMRECRAPTTVLYFHGGAFCLLDPSSHRPTTQKLAKITGGRCYSVRYRLAPKHAFPAAVLDAFVSYLTLLYPPPDAYHEPVPPEHLVVSGDSAGGNLTLVLVQLILELRRQGQPVMWHGELREVRLPAGVACNSPWMDITHSSPPFQGSTPFAFDYLPKPDVSAKANVLPCDIWPAKPPRKYLYVDAALATHPLASPIMARSWAGAPPVYICTGWELLAFEDKFIAKKLAGDGATVVFEQYEAMPHCFAMILTKTPNARRCLDAWGGFVRKAVEDPAGIAPSATGIGARTLEETALRFDSLSDVGEGEMRDQVARKAKEPAVAKL